MGAGVSFQFLRPKEEEAQVELGFLSQLPSLSLRLGTGFDG